MLMRPRAPRVFYDVIDGWTVESQIALDALQLKACVDFVKKIQGPRLKHLPRGDAREQAAEALQKLTPRTLKVRLLPESGYSGGESVLYQPNHGR